MEQIRHHHPSSLAQGVISPSQPCLCKLRGAQGRWEHKLRTVSGKAQPQCPGMSLIMIGQEEQFHIPFQTVDMLPRAVEHVMGCCGRAFWDCIGLTMGCLGKKPEVEKGIDSDDLGRNNCEQIKVWGDKQSWKCVNSSLSGHAPQGWQRPMEGWYQSEPRVDSASSWAGLCVWGQWPESPQWVIPPASPRWDQGQSLSGCSAGVQLSVRVLLGSPGETVSVSSAHAYMCVCEDLSKQSGAVVPLIHMTRNQQLEGLGSRSSYWTDWVSEPSCRWGPHCTCV